MSEYESLGGEGSPSSSSQPPTPSHTAAWLRRQFSGGGDVNSNKESTGGETREESQQWPDLLVDRRPMQERRSQAGKDCISAVERNNLVAVAALVVRAVVEASLRFANLLFL